MMTISVLPMTGTYETATTMVPKPDDRQRRIQHLNDQLRVAFAGGRVMMTMGVQALGDDQRAVLICAVQGFSNFTSANDPYGEHDFGRVVVGRQGYFFKIDTYDLDYRCQSPDPADEAVTARVMTIMREDEY